MGFMALSYKTNHKPPGLDHTKPEVDRRGGFGESTSTETPLMRMMLGLGTAQSQLMLMMLVPGPGPKARPPQNRFRRQRGLDESFWGF